MIQGCPFDTVPKPELKVFLKKMRRGVKHSEIEELVHLGPQAACTKFFNGSFEDLPYREEITRPTEFFHESEKRLSPM
jgi:hypothetical protein